MPSALTQAVDSIAGFIVDYAIALAAVGTLTMAIVEAWKKVLRRREQFHMRAVWNWMDNGDAYRELIHLTTGERMEKVVQPDLHRPPMLDLFRPQEACASALFGLGLSKLLAQVQSAADMAMNEPKLYPALYAFFADSAPEKDRKAWTTAAAKPATARTTDAAAKKTADLFARLNQLVRRKLDAFQLLTSHRWALLNQRNALYVGALVMFLSLTWMRSAGFERALGPGVVFQLILMSLIGGLLAPVAKDLVTSLAKFKRGV